MVGKFDATLALLLLTVRARIGGRRHPSGGTDEADTLHGRARAGPGNGGRRIGHRQLRCVLGATRQHVDRGAGRIATLRIGATRIDLSLGRSQRSEEHTSELQSLMRISYAVFCLKKKNNIMSQLSSTNS